jgi:hypothetical protein
MSFSEGEADHVRLARELRGELFPRTRPTSPPADATPVYESALMIPLFAFGVTRGELFDVFRELGLTAPVDDRDQRRRIVDRRGLWSKLATLTVARGGSPPRSPRPMPASARRALQLRREQVDLPLQGSRGWDDALVLALSRLHSAAPVPVAIEGLTRSSKAQRVLVEILLATRVVSSGSRGRA